MPETLQIEAVSKCNFSCVYCPRDKLTRKEEVMPAVLFFDVINLYGPLVKKFTLNKDGEFLLHPEWHGLLKLLETHRKPVRIPSNGVRLNKSVVEKLGELKIPIKLVVTEHTVGRDVDQEKIVEEAVRPNLRNLIMNKPDNISLSIQKLHVPKLMWHDAVEDFKKVYYALHKKYGGFTYKVNEDIDPWAEFNPYGGPKPVKCPYGHMKVIVVGVTGNMLLCCTDLNEECIIGNINNEQPVVLLERRRKLFKQINGTGWKELAPCRRCLRK